MRAIKKPIPIDVVRLLDNVENNSFTSHMKLMPVSVADGTYQVWNEKSKQWLNLHWGDYVNVTDPNDVYPIPADYFRDHYEVIER